MASPFVIELANQEHNWYDLGYFLGIEKYRLDTINRQHRLDGELRCLIEVFDYLDKNDSTPTWLQVITALRRMGPRSSGLADSLAIKYLREKQDQPVLLPRSRPRVHSIHGQLTPSSSLEEENEREDCIEYDVLVDSSVSKQLNKLIRSFVRLSLHVKRAVESNATPERISELQMVIDQYYELKPLEGEDATVNNVFSRIQRNLTFFNFSLFEVLILDFANGNREVLKEYHKYEKEYRKFEKSTRMKQLKQIIAHENSQLQGRRALRLKLKDFWERRYLSSVKKLMINVVSDTERCIKLSVTDGCVCVTWKIPGNMKILSLASSAGFMRNVGVISLDVGDKPFFSTNDTDQHSTIETQFLSAVAERQMEAVCVLLAISDDPVNLLGTVSRKDLEELVDSNGWSLLHFACAKNYDNVVEAVLTTNSIPPDVEDQNGWTPLMVAISNLHIGVAKLVIGRANGNARNKDGTTAIFVSCQTGQAVIVNDLLQDGANPQFPKTNGMTPLMIASQNGNMDIISLLIKEGKVEVNDKNAKGETAVNIASNHGHDKVVALLVESGADLEALDNHGYTALMRASGKGFAKVVDILIQKVNVNTSSKTGLTALHLASRHGYTILVSTLLSYGADPLSKLKDGLTPFLQACSQGHGAVVNTILHQSDRSLVPALLQDSSKDGKTGLYYASRSGCKGAVETLLKHGADPNAADRDGSTPLMAASYKGFTWIAERLLKEKAKVNAMYRKNGSTALYQATDKGHSDIASLLLEHGADPNIVITSNRWTPLIQATAKGHDHIVQLLLQHRAKVDMQAIDGSTALHFASMYGHIEIVRLLLNANANIDLKNRKGLTAYDIALSKHFNVIARMLNDPGESGTSGVGTMSVVESDIGPESDFEDDLICSSGEYDIKK